MYTTFASRVAIPIQAEFAVNASVELKHLTKRKIHDLHRHHAVRPSARMPAVQRTSLRQITAKGQKLGAKSPKSMRKRNSFPSIAYCRLSTICYEFVYAGLGHRSSFMTSSVRVSLFVFHACRWSGWDNVRTEKTK